MEKDDIPYGEKMITFKLRFFTTGLSNKRMALDKGAITVVTNRSRGIRNTPTGHGFFHSLEEIPLAVKKVLKKNDIILVRKDEKSKNTLVINLDG